MAVTLTPVQVRAYAPQFADVEQYPDAMVQAVLDECPLHLEGFGTEAQQVSAWRLWTCHTLTVQSPDAAGAAGPVVAQSVGRVSVQFGGASVLAGSYSRTAYGQRLQNLIDANFGGPLVC